MKKDTSCEISGVSSKMAEFDAPSGKFWIYNARLANRFNQEFKTYDSGKYFFEIGDEVVFKVPPDRLSKAMEIVRTFKKITPLPALSHPTEPS